MEACTISERKYKLKPQSKSYFPVIILYQGGQPPVVDWGGGMSASCNGGSNCSLTPAMDGRIVRCGIISSCQSAATSVDCKALLSHVSSAVASTGLNFCTVWHWADIFAGVPAVLKLQSWNSWNCKVVLKLEVVLKSLSFSTNVLLLTIVVHAQWQFNVLLAALLICLLHTWIQFYVLFLSETVTIMVSCVALPW